VKTSSLARGFYRSLRWQSLWRAVSVEAAVEVISLNYRSAPEVLPLVEKHAFARGQDLRRRAHELPHHRRRRGGHRPVKQSLAVIDAPVRQATVRVRFQESGRREERSVSAGAGFGATTGPVSSDERRAPATGWMCAAQDRSVSRSGSSEYFINALSGSWAYIRVGQDIPYTARWADLCRRYGRTVVYQRIENGFDVKPVIRANMAHVRVVAGAYPKRAPTGRTGGGAVCRSVHPGPGAVGPVVTIGGSDQTRKRSPQRHPWRPAAAAVVRP